MYLKTLSLKGFKSFADKVTLNLEPGITAIVGPNGSGKSNISDAVLWVLGERNAKHLRGNSMEDVIFAGSSARKSTSYAEVSLVLDNTDRTLDIDFAQIVITRRMYKSGESEYLINDTLARRMDILDILHDSGLGTGTHSIISQGSLDSVLQSKPEDRRALIEEAAGVLKHKQRLEKSSRKLEKMSNNVARISDVVQEISRQLKPLERKARQAKTYAELTEELTRAKLEIAVDDLRGLRANHEKTLALEAEKDKCLAEAKEKVEQTELRLEQIQEEIRVSNEGAGKLSTYSRRASASLEHIDSCILMAREHVRRSEERANEIDVELERYDLELETLTRDFESSKQESDAFTSNYEKKREQVNELAARAEELTSKLNEQDALVSDYIKEESALEVSIIDLTEKQTRAREDLANRSAQMQATEERIASLREEVAESRISSSEALESAKVLEESLNALDAEEKNARNLVASCIQARKEADEALDSAKQSVSSLDAQISALEELEKNAIEGEGQFRVWLEDNREDLGIDISPLSRKLSIKEGYEDLLDTILSKDSKALLVASVSEIERIIDTDATQEHSGRATLLLMEDPSRAQGEDSLLSLPEGAFLLMDILKFDSSIEGVVRALLGNIVVCESLKQAIDAHISSSSPFIYVSKSGDMVWPSGKVIIGSANSDSASNEFIRVRRMGELRAALDEAKDISERALNKAQEAERALANAQEESLSLTERLAQLKGNARAARDEAERAAERLSAQSQDLENAENTLKQLQDSIESAKPDVEQVTSDLERGKARLTELKELIQSSKINRLPFASELEDISFQLNEAKLELAKLSEKNEYQKRVLMRHVQDMDKVKQRRDEALELQKSKAYIAKRIAPIIEALDVISECASSLASRLEADASSAAGESEHKLGLINELRQKSKAAHAEHSSIAEELSAIKIEKTRLEMQVEAAVKVILEECNTSVETALTLPELENRQEVEESVFKLSRRIQNMGTINPDAAEEYDKLRVRYDFMFGQLEDLNNATRSLRRINSIIESRMKEDFAKTFETVNENFKEIFSTLFPNGNGYLSLIDPDDVDSSGIEVNAQPAGKRIRKMSLMSGGEKSLTALALLFALYKTRATPFYILDEVEAALDDTNLRRLIAYINAMRDTTQMIMITHQRRTMESADVLFGVSMQSDGVTKVISQKLDAALRNAE